MTFDFTLAGEFENIQKHTAPVKTPSSTGESSQWGDSWTTEDNTVTKYTVNGKEIWVTKISTLGWNVRVYDGGKHGQIPVLRTGYFENETDAHMKARELVEEIVSND